MIHVNNQPSINLGIVAVMIVSLIVGAYFLLNKASESDQTFSVENVNNKADSFVIPSKETVKSMPSASMQKNESNKQGTKKNNEQANEQEPTLANNPDEFGIEKELPEFEPLSIGEFIPASTPDMIAAEEDYKATNKNYTAPTEAEIQAEFEAFNNEVNTLSIGVEIGEYIPVDEISNNGSTEAKEIGEFISANPELL